MTVAKTTSARTKGAKPVRALQFKVTLKYIDPPIWRRLVLRDDAHLGDLHDAIQTAMGWWDSHLHAFRIGGVHYTSTAACAMGDMDMEDETEVCLREFAGRSRTKFDYEYDFGDSWEHEIVVEKVLPFDPAASSPACLDGARACPPEDCGSYPGYMDILEALKAKKRTPDQRDLLKWVGRAYHPEGFDLLDVNRALAPKAKSRS